MSREPTLDAAGRAGLPLRRDGAFRRYWLARVISLLGSAVTYLALPVLVYQVTGSSLWTALVTFAEGAPYLCVGLLAGAVADRLDRRRLMVATDLASAAVLASVPAAYAAGVLTAPHLLVAAFAVQTLFVFFDAANFGALPVLVGRDRIVAAQAALMGTGTVMELVVPALAGAALAVVAAAPLLAVDAVSFVCSALLLRAITRPLWDPARAGRPRRLAVEVRDGLTFLWRQRVVRTTTLVGATQAFTGGLFLGQLVPWADQVLGVPPGDARLGLLFAAWGLGGLAATVLAPSLARRAGEPRVTLRFLPLSTLGLLACALAGRWLPAAISIAGLGRRLHGRGARRDHPAAAAHPRPAPEPGQHRRKDALVRPGLAARGACRWCRRRGRRPARRAARRGRRPAVGHGRGLAVTAAHGCPGGLTALPAFAGGDVTRPEAPRPATTSEIRAAARVSTAACPSNPKRRRRRPPPGRVAGIVYDYHQPVSRGRGRAWPGSEG